MNNIQIVDLVPKLPELELPVIALGTSSSLTWSTYHSKEETKMADELPQEYDAIVVGTGKSCRTTVEDTYSYEAWLYLFSW